MNLLMQPWHLLVSSLADWLNRQQQQVIDNRLIDLDEEVGRVNGKIECRERLGGLLKYYYPDAA